MSAAISTTLRSDGAKAAAAKRPMPFSAPESRVTIEISDEIGEGDAAEQHGEIELRRIGGEARREREGQPDHADLGDDGDDEERRGERGERFFGETARLGDAVGLMDLGEERHEGRGEGAFGEEAAEEIGKALGDEEGLGDRPGAERGGDEHVADEAENAARRRRPADGGEVLQEGHRVPFPHAGSLRLAGRVSAAAGGSSKAARRRRRMAA